MEKIRESELKTRIYGSKFKWQDPGLICLKMARAQGPPLGGDCLGGSGANECSPNGSGAFFFCASGDAF